LAFLLYVQEFWDSSLGPETIILMINLNISSTLRGLSV
jgi:hypothetical protein